MRTCPTILGYYLKLRCVLSMERACDMATSGKRLLRLYACADLPAFHLLFASVKLESTQRAHVFKRTCTALSTVVCAAAMSTWLPLRKEEQILSDACQNMPLFMAHGEQDELVKFEFGQMTRQLLSEKGMQNVEFHSYPMGHSACPEEIGALGQWLQKTVPPQ